MSEARARLVDHECVTCNIKFQAVKGRLYCDRCRDQRIADRLRRKSVTRRGVQATGERITIDQLGDECAWTCWICGEFVNRELQGKDPWMPSFDHVLPISLGGTDARENLKLAHLSCNIRRGNRLTGATV